MQKPVCPMCNAELSGFAWLQTKAFRITCPHCKKQISLTRRSKQRLAVGHRSFIVYLLASRYELNGLAL